MTTIKLTFHTQCFIMSHSPDLFPSLAGELVEAAAAAVIAPADATVSSAAIATATTAIAAAAGTAVFGSGHARRKRQRQEVEQSVVDGGSVHDSGTSRAPKQKKKKSAPRRSSIRPTDTVRAAPASKFKRSSVETWQRTIGARSQPATAACACAAGMLMLCTPCAGVAWSSDKSLVRRMNMTVQEFRTDGWACLRAQLTRTLCAALFGSTS